MKRAAIGSLVTKIRAQDSGKLDIIAGSDTDFLYGLGLPSRYCWPQVIWIHNGDMAT